VLSWAAVAAAITSGTHTGGAGFAHGVFGATIAYAAAYTMMPRCPKAPPTK
jgi:hypothetical protein